MKKIKSINFVPLTSIPILLIGFGISFFSYFFNKMLPEGIISTGFPPFYLFFIGMILFIVGLFLFFWNKIQRLGRKKIGITVTLVVVFFIILSTPIISRSLTTSTGRFIRNEEVVWESNQSIATETELKSMFESNIMAFWEQALNILKENQLSYPENAVPLLEKIRVDSSESYSSMNRWVIRLPAIPEGADWRIGFFDGYIEIYEEGSWHDTSYVFFNVEKENGIVRVEV